MLHHLSNIPIVLGSSSPRRRQLFDLLKIDYKIEKSTIEEIYPDGLNPVEVAMYLSTLKAADIYCRLDPSSILITADTIVVYKNEILGKPANRKDAISMIQKLSGASHQVITAVSITDKNGTHSFHDETKVWFAPLSPEEITWYVGNNQVLDKAGAYGIQDWLGVCKIDRIEGNYYTVMGLPVHLLYRALSKLKP